MSYMYLALELSLTQESLREETTSFPSCVFSWCRDMDPVGAQYTGDVDMHSQAGSATWLIADSVVQLKPMNSENNDWPKESGQEMNLK